MDDILKYVFKLQALIETSWKFVFFMGIMTFFLPELIVYAEDENFKLFLPIIGFLGPCLRIMGLSFIIYAGYLKSKNSKKNS